MNIQNSSDKVMNIRNLSNKELYALCKEYGKNARKWSREFGFLLPEVSSRKMYRKYRCASIFEFAAKLAGMSYKLTSRILNLAKKLEDKPVIWNEFRQCGWSKLEIVERVITADNQNFWLDKLRKLPKAALVEYAKKYAEHTNANGNGAFAKNSNQNGLFGLEETKIAGAPNFGGKFTDKNFQNHTSEMQQSDYLKSDTASTPTGHNDSYLKPFRKIKFRVDSETEFEFKKFKQTMEKEKKEVLTMGETLKLLLRKVGELENTKSDSMGSAHHDNPNNHVNQDGSISLSRLHHKPIRKKHNQKYTQYRRHIKFIAASVMDRALNQVYNKSRLVPRRASQKIRKSIIAAYDGMCAFSGCNEPYSELHHPDRFSLKKSHQRIYPLCRLHHQLANAGLIKNEELTIENWEVDFEKKEHMQENLLSVSDLLDGTVDSSSQKRMSKLEMIFDHYQKMEKQRVDQIVRDHWNA